MEIPKFGSGSQPQFTLFEESKEKERSLKDMRSLSAVGVKSSSALLSPIIQHPSSSSSSFLLRKVQTDPIDLDLDMASRASSPGPVAHQQNLKQVFRTKSDSHTHRSRSKTNHDITGMKRFAKLSIPSRFRSKSWDANSTNMDERLAQLIQSRQSKGSTRKPPLTQLCLHCRFANELKTHRVRAEMGRAVLSLATEVEQAITFPGERRRKSLQAALRLDVFPKPNVDIIVSSVSSDEEEDESEDTLGEVTTVGGMRETRSDTLSSVTTSESATSSRSTSPSMPGTGSSSEDNRYDLSDVPIINVTGCMDIHHVSRQIRSCSIVTAASEAETLIFRPSPSPDVLTPDMELSPRSTPSPGPIGSDSDTLLSLPHLTPPQSPTPLALFSDPYIYPSTPAQQQRVVMGEEINHLDVVGMDSASRPPLDSFSSGKVSCSCILPSCFSKFIHTSHSISSPKSDLSGSYYESDGSSISGQIHKIYLEPPSASSLRSSSVDLPTLRRDIELLSSGDEEGVCSSLSSNSLKLKKRSKSVDYDNGIRRPSRLQRLAYIIRKALNRSPILGRSDLLESTDQSLLAGGKHRTSKYWSEITNPSEHIWLPGGISSGVSGTGLDCHIGERDCRKTGEKRQCAACHVMAHSGCLPLLTKMNLCCKPSFRETVHKPRNAQEASFTKHHWVHRWRQEGKCGRCGKSFQAKLFNRDKEVLAISCSWCKTAYHNKHGCFLMSDLEEQCSMGLLVDIIIPPNWILKLPVIKPSMFRRRFSQCSHTSRRRSRKKRLFAVKPPDPLPFIPGCPLLIFVNPKSGGNKGARLINTFCWLVNPRQVFDITAMKGPKYGLEMFRKLLPRLRILVCGGDGTVGWLLSTLDSLRWAEYPPIGILPLGTGNDLGRTLGWGGSFTDEAMESLLLAVGEGSAITHLDRFPLDTYTGGRSIAFRWQCVVEPNNEAEWEETVAESAEEVHRQLPLSVMNNYFSIGADANVALQFHQSRSANPDILNSRFKNRLFYGGIGTVDLFKRSWKDLSEFITIECDGVDLTSRIQDLKLHCILILNIPRYAGGTLPWGNPKETASGGSATPSTTQLSPAHIPTTPSCPSPMPGAFPFLPPSINDGKIEVLGFTTTSLATLQVGGRGERLAQCSTVKIVTTKPIPAQVDGEPCRLAPSIINIKFHSKVPMLRRVSKTSSGGRRTESMSSYGSAGGSHKISTVSVTDYVFQGEDLPAITAPSRRSFTAYLLKIPLTVVSWKDYDSYKDDVEQLKLCAFEVGSIGLNSEDELEKVRPFVHQLLSNGRKPRKSYTPSLTWHFVDYVSSSGEAYRVPRVQETLHSVADICNTEEFLLIMDDAFVSSPKKKGILKHGSAAEVTQTDDELGDLPTKEKFSKRKSSRKKRKRFSEPLKLILSGESGETHL